jgi:hypothetical protein
MSVDPNDPTIRCPNEDDDDDDDDDEERSSMTRGCWRQPRRATKRGKGTLRPTRGGCLPQSPCAL